MKKTVLTILSSFFCSFTLTAQTVTNLGTTTINRTISDSPIGDLTVGNYPSSWAGGSAYYRCIYAAQPTYTTSFNIGVDARMVHNTNQDSMRSFGVRGIAGRATEGYNYGVFGGLVGDHNGAGVFGTILNHTGVYVPGKYAGYFDGATYVSGKLTAKEVYTPSDMRLTENVTALSGSNTLGKILSLNVFEYNLKDITYKTDTDTATVAESKEVAEQKAKEFERVHYGVSAQELQELFPNLIEEGQNGYLAVNYIEMVPILIQSIQELKKELEDWFYEDE